MKLLFGILVFFLSGHIAAHKPDPAAIIKGSDSATHTVTKTLYHTIVRRRSEKLSLPGDSTKGPLGTESAIYPTRNSNSSNLSDVDGTSTFEPRTSPALLLTPSSYPLEPRGIEPKTTQRPVHGVPIVFSTDKDRIIKRDTELTAVASPRAFHKRNVNLYNLKLDLCGSDGYMSIYMPSNTSISFCKRVGEKNPENQDDLEGNRTNVYYQLNLSVGNSTANVPVREDYAVMFCRQVRSGNEAAQTTTTPATIEHASTKNVSESSSMVSKPTSTEVKSIVSAEAVSETAKSSQATLTPASAGAQAVPTARSSSFEANEKGPNPDVPYLTVSSINSWYEAINSYLQTAEATKTGQVVTVSSINSWYDYINNSMRTAEPTQNEVAAQPSRSASAYPSSNAAARRARVGTWSREKSVGRLIRSIAGRTVDKAKDEDGDEEGLLSKETDEPATTHTAEEELVDEPSPAEDNAPLAEGDALPAEDASPTADDLPSKEEDTTPIAAESPPALADISSIAEDAPPPTSTTSPKANTAKAKTATDNLPPLHLLPTTTVPPNDQHCVATELPRLTDTPRPQQPSRSHHPTQTNPAASPATKVSLPTAVSVSMPPPGLGKDGIPTLATSAPVPAAATTTQPNAADLEQEESIAWNYVFDRRVAWMVMVGWALGGLEVAVGLWEFVRGVRGDAHLGRKFAGAVRGVCA